MQLAKLQTNFTSIFNREHLRIYKVAGQEAGVYKNAGTFSYVRIFGAGHEVSPITKYYFPENGKSKKI